MYKTYIPSDTTNNPRGLAYDSVADELYVLVDGKAEDAVVVLDKSSGTAVRNFPVEGFSDTFSIHYLDGNVYVGASQDGMCCGPAPQWIIKLDAQTGAEVSKDRADDMMGTAYGMDHDGSNFITSNEYGGPHVEVLGAGSYERQSDIYFYDPNDHNSMNMVEGFTAVAYRTSDEEIFVAKGVKIWRSDSTGRIMQESTINTANVTSIHGAVFVGSNLYLADRGTSSIYSTGIPVPPTTISSDPRGMVTDGTSMYIVIDAEPADKLLKTNMLGVLDATWGDSGVVDLPGTEVDGITMTDDGSLYIVSNDERTVAEGGHGFRIERYPAIHKLNAATGAEVSIRQIEVEDDGGYRFQLFEPIRALTTDGTNLLFASPEQGCGYCGVWYKMNPNSYDPARFTWQYSGNLPEMRGFESLLLLPAEDENGKQLFAESQRLVGAGQATGPDPDTIARFDRTSGAMFAEVSPGSQNGQFKLNGMQIKGTAYSGLTLYVADDVTDTVYSTAMPENTIELTLVGDYSVGVAATVGLGGVSTYEADAVQFSVKRNSSMAVEFTTISTPDQSDVALTAGFVVTDTAATISGRINDPSIDQIYMAIKLPSAVFVDDNVEDGGYSNSLWQLDTPSAAQWHRSCMGEHSMPPERVTSGECSWRYAKVGGSSFSTGSSTAGSMTSNDKIEVNPGTRVQFNTTYDTEISSWTDKKLIQVAIVVSDIQGNESLTAWETIGQIVGPGSGSEPWPDDASGDFRFLEREPLYIDDSMHHIVLGLGMYTGEDIKIRFKFDSVDGMANDGEGWFLDDIMVIGAGYKSKIVSTTLLTTPQVSGAESYFRTFTTPFELSEGENMIGFRAQQGYNPFIEAFTVINGFVDMTPPSVSLSIEGLPTGATSDLSQTINGQVDDQTFASLQLNQALPGGDVVTYAPSVDGDTGEFSANVSLAQGANTFTATVVDGGGLSTTSDALIITGDKTPPTARVKVVTVTSEGEAVTGDKFFVIVSAQDPLSGVARVDNVPGGLLADAQQLSPIEDVPEILVRMHGLGKVADGHDTTHIMYSEVGAGTPIGANDVQVRIQDAAGLSSTQSAQIEVVSARSNRNYFLFPGVNYMGLGLIPDDGDSGTTDDASLDRLMSQDVTESVNPGFASAKGGSVNLGDVVKSTFAFHDSGTFLVHSPGAGANDTLVGMAPFQGMTVMTNEAQTVDGNEYDVFHKVGVAGFSAEQAVPIRLNIEGVFFTAGGQSLPPSKVLRIGYNLIAPHVLKDTLFETVYRGALIPKHLAVSAITFQRRVDVSIDGTSISADILEGFETNSLGDKLKPEVSYWTFIVQDDPFNPTIPVITP
jgi:hypothetical protein